LMTLDDAFLYWTELLYDHRDILEEEFNKMKSKHVRNFALYDTVDDYIEHERNASCIARRVIKMAKASKGTFYSVFYHHYGDKLWCDHVEIISAGGFLTEQEAIEDMKKIAPEFTHTDTYETNSYGGKNMNYVFLITKNCDIPDIRDVQKRARSLGYRLKN